MKRMHCVAAALVLAGAGVLTAQNPSPRAVLPDSMKWAQNPNLLQGGETTLLAGKFTEAAPYAFRVRFPTGFRVMPHRHPDDRTYTVISGNWTIGIGETLDTTKVESYPPGTVYFLPANTPHYHYAKDGPSVAQINAVGPTATVYVRDEDDPRKK